MSLLSIKFQACLALVLAMAGFVGASAGVPPQALNHFNHLYADIEIGGRQMAVVHIYAQFPDYSYAIEPREGYTCVDDVARAIVMLVHEWQRRSDPELFRKIQRLTEFVLYLQNENGYFNNFLWGDLRINTDYKTSVAELNWWSLRALWGLEQAYIVLAQDPAFAPRIRDATARLVKNLTRDLLNLPRSRATIDGVSVPTWLPAGSGADQAGEAIVALLPHLKRTSDPSAQRLVESLADGLLEMQKGDAHHYPYGMILSWQNTWHAWGNIQAYALLMAGDQLARPAYTAAGLREIDNFYPYLLKTGLAESIQLRGDRKGYSEAKRERFPQIAYGIRPMVFAAVKAYALTKDPRYRELAKRLGGWLRGKNVAHQAMLDVNTGLVFDGIREGGVINRNSGAESTIEGLLTQQALQGILP